MDSLYYRVCSTLQDYFPSDCANKYTFTGAVTTLCKLGVFSAVAKVRTVSVAVKATATSAFTHQNEFLPSSNPLTRILVHSVSSFFIRCAFSSLIRIGAPGYTRTPVVTVKPAIVIPSGEGKTYLTRNYPDLFIDLDTAIGKAFEYTFVEIDGHPYYTDAKEGIYQQGLPTLDRKLAAYLDSEENKQKVLLTLPNQTHGRTVYAVYLAPQTTGIRLNVTSRATARCFYPDKTQYISPSLRNEKLIQFAKNYNSHYNLRKFWSADRIRDTLTDLLQ